MSIATTLNVTKDESITGCACTILLPKESSGIGEAVNDNAWPAPGTRLQAEHKRWRLLECMKFEAAQQSHPAVGHLYPQMLCLPVLP
jgi:hypothetical protein